ncbi:MAG: hypothetical protein R3B82_13310 [Sandaracinaceae bacterium]
MQAVANRPVGPKVLRIGLIQGDKIVEERIIRKRETVTVGSSEKNHFVVSAGGLSSRFELFQLVGNDYILNFTDQMRGRVGLAGGVKVLDGSPSGGAARRTATTRSSSPRTHGQDRDRQHDAALPVRGAAAGPAATAAPRRRRGRVHRGDRLALHRLRDVLLHDPLRVHHLSGER